MGFLPPELCVPWSLGRLSLLEAPFGHSSSGFVVPRLPLAPLPRKTFSYLDLLQLLYKVAPSSSHPASSPVSSLFSPERRETTKRTGKVVANITKPLPCRPPTRILQLSKYRNTFSAAPEAHARQPEQPHVQCHIVN